MEPYKFNNTEFIHLKIFLSFKSKFNNSVGPSSYCRSKFMTGLVVLITAVQCIDESKSIFVAQTRMQRIEILKFSKKRCR